MKNDSAVADVKGTDVWIKGVGHYYVIIDTESIDGKQTWLVTVEGYIP